MQFKICIALLCLFLFNPSDYLNAQCDDFEDYVGPIFNMRAPVFNNLPVLVPDQDGRSIDDCTSSEDGIDPGEYFDLLTDNKDYEIYSDHLSGVDVYLNGGLLSDGSGVASFHGSGGVSYQVADLTSICDPAIAPFVLRSNEQIFVKCTSCPEIPTILPGPSESPGLDSLSFLTPVFNYFSNFSNDTDPLGNMPHPKERSIWYFHNSATLTPNGLHRGKRIPISPAAGFADGNSEGLVVKTLELEVKNIVFNAPSRFDQQLGISIIASDSNDGSEQVVYANIMDHAFDLDGDGIFNFVISSSSIDFDFSKSYFLQFWTTADIILSFGGCIEYESYAGHFAAFEYKVGYYSPPSPPANDDCADAQVIVPSTAVECAQMESNRFLASTYEAAFNALGCQQEFSDVWYRFTATSSQYELQTGGDNEVVYYYVQLLEGNDCASLSPVSCDYIEERDTVQYLDLQIGHTYYIRFIASYSTDKGAFEFCLRDLQTTCLFPDVAVAPACLNNEFYEIEITVTDMRGNSQLTVQDLINQPPLPDLVITTPGVYPFAQIDTSVTFSIQLASDEAACNVTYTGLKPDCTAEPPVNDLCSTAGLLQIGNNNCYSSFNTTATNSYPACGSTDYVDIWFTFQAQSRSHYLDLTVFGSPTIGLEVFTGDCDNLTSVYCGSGSGHWLNELVEGTTYYVVLDLPASPIFYTFCNQSFPSASNDDCPESIHLAVQANCNPQTFTNAGATPQLMPLVCMADNSGDVWFDFVATTPDVTIRLDNISPLVANFNGDLVAGLYSGNCGALVERACTAFTQAISDFTLNNLIPGQQYYLRISSSHFDEYFNFDLCIIGQESPANDVCANAVFLPINPGIVCTQSLNGSTSAAIAAADPDCMGNAVQDVWYQFTPTSTEYIILINTDGFVEAEIYSGDCNNLVSVLGCGNSPIRLEGLTINQAYFVRVYSTAGFGVDFEICMLTVPPPPANDVCSGALSLNIGSELCEQTTTATFMSATASDLDCDGQAIDRDVWFSFTATASNLNVSILNIVDALTGQENGFATIGFEYYQGDCNGLLPLACIDNIAFNNMPMTGLNLGDTYYIRLFVDNFSEDLSFDVCLSDDRMPPNDERVNAITLIQEPSMLCTGMTRGTFAYATTSLAANTCNLMTGAANDDVWFQFVASSANPTINVEYLMGSYVVELFDTDGVSLLDCANDAPLTPLGLTDGQTYYLRVYTFEPIDMTGTDALFSICVNGLPTLIVSNANNNVNPDECLVVNQQVTSNAANSWLHIQHQGEMVASIFDSEVLGVINTSFFIHSGSIRSNGLGIEYLDRNFTITPATQPSNDILLRLYFTQAELNAIINANDNDGNDITSIDDLVVSRFNGASCSSGVNANNGILYTAQGSGSFGADGFYIDILINQFSSFFIHGGTQVLLPVEMGDFTAKNHKKGIDLQWETFSESNNAGFDIERSTDGRHFSSISWIAGVGNSNQTQQYSFLDTDVAANQLYYYRLKQVDFAGKVSYSHTISGIWKQKTKDELLVYPNPANELFNIVWENTSSIQTIEIFDLQGKRWSTHQLNTSSSKIQLHTNNWPAGLYFIFGMDQFGRKISQKKLSVIHL